MAVFSSFFIVLCLGPGTHPVEAGWASKPGSHNSIPCVKHPNLEAKEALRGPSVRVLKALLPLKLKRLEKARESEQN